MTTTRIVQVGVNGYGRQHLKAIDALGGAVELVAAVDPHPGDFDGVPVYASLEEALATHRADVVQIAAPIGKHAPLASLALEHEADVLLEKPPTASLAEFDALVSMAERAGRLVQVGFQSLGSTGVAALREARESGVLGATRVAAWGAWRRSDGYYLRSPWAGHRTLDGRPIADGAVTNPLAHAVATALAVAGATRADQVEWVETELYRAHDIHTDDTAWLRIATTVGEPIHVSLTLCADVAGDDPSPSVALMGSTGTARFRYTDDEIDWEVDGRSRTERCGRVGLLANLLDARLNGAPLAAPLTDAGAFMCVLEASMTSPEPQPVAERFLRPVGEGSERVPLIPGVGELVRETAGKGLPFSASDVPWATSAPTRWKHKS